MNRVKIKIYNKEYSLQTEETPEYTQALAKKLDLQLAQMLNSGSGMSLFDACIIISLSAMDDAQKANSNLDNLRTQIKDYVDEASNARNKCAEYEKEIAELKIKNDELEQLLELG